MFDITVTPSLVVGTLLLTFLMSRLFRWLWRKAGHVSLLPPHVASYLCGVVIGDVGLPLHPATRFGRAAVIYLLPQLFWLAVDWFRAKDVVRAA